MVWITLSLMWPQLEQTFSFSTVPLPACELDPGFLLINNDRVKCLLVSWRKISPWRTRHNLAIVPSKEKYWSLCLNDRLLRCCGGMKLSSMEPPVFLVWFNWFVCWHMIVTTNEREVALRKEDRAIINQSCCMCPKCKSWTNDPAMCRPWGLCFCPQAAWQPWCELNIYSHALPSPGKQEAGQAGYQTWLSFHSDSGGWAPPSGVELPCVGRWTRGRWVRGRSRAQTCRQGLKSVVFFKYPFS